MICFLKLFDFLFAKLENLGLKLRQKTAAGVAKGAARRTCEFQPFLLLLQVFSGSRISRSSGGSSSGGEGGRRECPAASTPEGTPRIMAHAQMIKITTMKLTVI